MRYCNINNRHYSQNRRIQFRTFVFSLAAVLPAAILYPAMASEKAAAGNWVQHRGPFFNGVSPETGLLDRLPKSGPEQLWKKNIGTGFSSVIVHDGRLFISGNKKNRETQVEEDTIYCLRADSGETVWEYTYPAGIFDVQHEGGPASSPVTDGNGVYALSKNAEFFALDAKTGKELWVRDLKEDFGVDIPRWGISCTPLIEGDLVIVEVGPTLAFHKKSGDLVWQSERFTVAYSSPVPVDLNGKRCVSVLNAYGLVIFQAADGKEVLRFPFETRYNINCAMPIFIDNQVFLSASYGHGSALIQIDEKDRPSLVWENKLMENHINGSVVIGDYAYGYSGHYGRKNEGLLKCLNVKTGELMWTEDSVARGSLIFADGKLILLSGNGELVFAKPNPVRFDEISRSQVLGGKCWTEPTLVNRKLYCRNAKRDLICLDVSAQDDAKLGPQ